MRKPFGIRKSSEISQILRLGKKEQLALFSYLFRINNLGYFRSAVIISKKTEKKAVRRNRVRRQISQWLRKNELLRLSPFDAIFIPKKEAFSSPRRLLYENLRSMEVSLLRRARAEADGFRKRSSLNSFS